MEYRSENASNKSEEKAEIIVLDSWQSRLDWAVHFDVEKGRALEENEMLLKKT